MNGTQMQCETHDPVVLVKYEHRSAGGSWEEPVNTVRGTQLRRSQRLNSTLDGRSSGQLRNTLSRARELCERWRTGGGSGHGFGGNVHHVTTQNNTTTTTLSAPTTPVNTPDDEGGGKLSRWFSVRRGSHHHYDMTSGTSDKMPKLPESEEECTWSYECARWRRPAPALPPTPPALTPQQQRRRHVVQALIHSENSYVSTLQRLLNDYKRPLEESSPSILNASKVSTLFHRLPDILECHLQFRIALASAAETWDRDEKIGDVFLTAFSKAVILDVYSDFINNFSVAMELAKMESKRKSALADFFKVKQIRADDRLSFFGLMVKPVQRFPQFIMFLQDLLKYTPSSHADRLALQRALTRLEALTDALNERKREAERTQAFRETMRRLGGRGAGPAAGGTHTRFGAAKLLATNADRRHLLRQDDVDQLEFNQWGCVSKCKSRRLLLLNDLVVCAAVARAGGEQETERLSLKWAAPVADVELLDAPHHAAPTLSRVLAHGFNRCGSMRSNSTSGTVTGDTLCGEMASLMHDYEVVSRLADLASSLKGNYSDISPDVFKKVLKNIQQGIQRRDDEMSWVEGCWLQLAIRGREETVTLRTRESGTRTLWAAELRLAQLAAAPANCPAWRLSASRSAHPPHKMPLLVGAHPLFSSERLTEVSCVCVYTESGTGSRTRSLVWCCVKDTVHTRLHVLHHRHAKLKPLFVMDLNDIQVKAIQHVPPSKKHNCGGEVWLGTSDSRVLRYPASEPEKRDNPTEVTTPAPVIQICCHHGAVFLALENGVVLIYNRDKEKGWKEPTVITLGDSPVHCLLPIDQFVYATCKRKISAIDVATTDIGKVFEADISSGGSENKYVRFLAHSGAGLWIALNQSTYVSLYHAETFEHLQDVDIALDVAKTIGAREGSRPAHISALLACDGLLWVGTTAGVSVSVPLPRLEGLPLVGHAAVSHHAHAGPVTFLISLTPEPRENSAGRRTSRIRALMDAAVETEEVVTEGTKLERRASDEASPHRVDRAGRRRRVPDARLSRTLARCANLGARDVYGLYGDLMFVKDCCGVAGDTDSSVGNENLRKSDPELATIPFRVSTLDRRLKMRAGRPRSLDLSNWSVDSRSSSLCTSSGSEESMALRGLSRTGSAASRAPDVPSPVSPDAVSRSDSAASKLSSSGVESASSSGTSGQARSVHYTPPTDTRVSLVTLMCGRGYVDWRQLADASERPPPTAEPNPRDATILIWETRL